MSEILFVTPADDLQAVFDAAPAGSRIRLAPGIYRQKVLLTTPGLTIEGAGMEESILVWDDYANKLDEFGREYNTFRTYTLAVCADHVTLRDLAVVNDALEPERRGQEVALSVLGDDVLLERCRLTSTQDTLFAGPLPPDLIERYEGFLRQELRRGGELRQIFRECRIEGTVDFIFGCGSALFDRCEIRSLVDARDVGYAAAPAHSPDQTEGYLFRNCCFTCEAGVTPGSIYLARPWRDYGLSVFRDCTYGGHIAAAGFDKWSGTERDKTARFRESPALPGRVSWVNNEEEYRK